MNSYRHYQPTNRGVRQTHFKLNRTFKVIQSHPCWCRQE